MHNVLKSIHTVALVAALALSQSACSQQTAQASGAARAQPAAASTAQPAAPSGPATADSVRKQWEARFAQIEVAQVQPAQMPGLWEVHTAGGDLFYADAQVNFVIEGALIDAKTRKNLTQERLDQMAFVKFKDLPFEAAIKQVRGNGKRQVAIFEDPNCGYCKIFRKNLANVTDITIYTFTYPILSENSMQKVRSVWCEKDKAKAWDDIMINGINPTAAPTCSSPVDKITEFGRKYRVRGTPTMFFADDTRIASAMSAEQFMQRLNAASK